MRIIRLGVRPAGMLAALMLFQVRVLPAQIATIRFDPNAPVSPIGSDEEYQALVAIQDEQDPARRYRLISDFLGDFARSEYRHLALRIRFQTRRALGADPEDILTAAREALEAEEYFFNTKMGYIDDPGSVPEIPAFRLDFAAQKAAYYQGMTEAYVALEDVENAALYAGTALDAEAGMWDLFIERYDEAAAEFGPELERHRLRQAAMLRVLILTAQVGNDLANELAYRRRLLEVAPDDVDTLVRVAELMSQPQQIPQEPEARAVYLGAAGDYATRAVEAVDTFLAGEASAQLEEARRALLVASTHSSRGMVHLQKGEYAEAADDYAISAESSPSAVTYYLFGVSLTNDEDVDAAAAALARAVYLNYPQPQARELLEVVYEVKTGSLEGLEEFIRSEGAQLGGDR